MAKIGYIIVCEDVFGDGEIIIKRPFNVIAPFSIPGNFSFVLSFSLFDLQKDVNYKLKMEIIEPDNSILISDNFDFQFTPPPQAPEKLKSGTINLKFNNVLFKKVGTYRFRITIDDESSNELKIPVFPSGQ